MATTNPSGILLASAFTFTDRTLRPGIACPVSFPLHQRVTRAPAVAVRVAFSPSSEPGTAAGSRLRGIMKPRPVSPAMQAIVGVPKIPRTQALKLIWTYIKEHNLQDPENKRIVICDDKLKAIFGGRDRVGFLEVSGLINPHFAKYRDRDAEQVLRSNQAWNTLKRMDQTRKHKPEKKMPSDKDAPIF